MFNSLSCQVYVKITLMNLLYSITIRVVDGLCWAKMYRNLNRNLHIPIFQAIIETHWIDFWNKIHEFLQ
jgi:uncharacterized membrane protein YjgN (DUF898 family)